jgi:hypothetical protein
VGMSSTVSIGMAAEQLLQARDRNGALNACCLLAARTGWPAGLYSLQVAARYALDAEVRNCVTNATAAALAACTHQAAHSSGNRRRISNPAGLSEPASRPDRRLALVEGHGDLYPGTPSGQRR